MNEILFNLGLGIQVIWLILMFVYRQMNIEDSTDMGLENETVLSDGITAGELREKNKIKKRNKNILSVLILVLGLSLMVISHRLSNQQANSANVANQLIESNS